MALTPNINFPQYDHAISNAAGGLGDFYPTFFSASLLTTAYVLAKPTYLCQKEI